MIDRIIATEVRELLDTFPVVALLGPRQVGKTTLAREIHDVGKLSKAKPVLYLDLELASDLNKLSEPELFLRRHQDELVILDEIQRKPDLFPLLRSLVDERIRNGDSCAHFLILGSASKALLQQSSETLAGRIAYQELTPFNQFELLQDKQDWEFERAWLRGGFPGSFLAKTDRVSWLWRGNFIATYVERDLPQLGFNFPAERMRRFWSMLAHGQGTTFNAARLAAGLGVSGNTVRSYLDLLSDLYMVRQLRPWAGNSTKRLVKAPKTYIRDSGLLHRLANVPELEMLLGHPLCGASWEGFVLESILCFLPDTWSASYYRTSAQAEIDLVLEGPGNETLAVEIKRSLTPVISKGFRLGCEDIKTSARFYVIPKGDAYPLGFDTEALSVNAFLNMIMKKWNVVS